MSPSSTTPSQLFEEFWNWRLKRSPEFASLVGGERAKAHNAELEEYTIQRFQDDYQTCQEFLKTTEQLLSGKLSGDDELNLRLFRSELTTFIDGSKFQGHLFPINYMEGVQMDFERLSEWMGPTTVRDYEDLIARYLKFERQAGQIVEVLKAGIAAGRTYHAISMNNVLDTFKNHVDKSAKDTAFFEPFAKLPESFSEGEKKELMEKAERAISSSVQPGMKKVKSFLEDTYLKHTRPEIAATSLPDGEAFYRECIRHHTSTDMDAKEIHEIGLKEVDKIELEMKEIIKSLGLETDLPTFLEKLRNDPKFFHESPEAVLADFKDIVENQIGSKLTKLFTRNPQHPLEVVAGLNENHPAGFYICGTEDGSRPGKFFVNVKKFKTQPKYEMMTLALHEGNPGHHLQASFQIAQKNMPKFRQHLEDRSYFLSPSRFPMNTAYVEGWALYTETLGTELGLYDDPYVRFGHLSYKIFRACRLVVDTGMHALGWTRQRAVDFMLAHTASSAKEIGNEVNRYITWPGQALGYMIGQIRIVGLRRRAEKELGGRFDVKEFHDVVLKAAGPLDVLEEEVEKYIKGRKA